MNLKEHILRERIRILTNRNQRPNHLMEFNNRLIETYRRMLNEKRMERMERERMEREEQDQRGGKKRRSKKSKRSKPNTKKSCNNRHMRWVQGCTCHIGYCRVKHNK
jgi:hypothetical protein